MQLCVAHTQRPQAGIAVCGRYAGKRCESGESHFNPEVEGWNFNGFFLFLSPADVRECDVLLVLDRSRPCLTDCAEKPFATIKIT
jgi:hypothetical protein